MVKCFFHKENSLVVNVTLTLRGPKHKLDINDNHVSVSKPQKTTHCIGRESLEVLVFSLAERQVGFADEVTGESFVLLSKASTSQVILILEGDVISTSIRMPRQTHFSPERVHG